MIPMSARLAQARVTISAQRSQLLHLHRQNSALAAENKRLRKALDADTSTLRRVLLANPVEAKRWAVHLHDRLLDLTRANATQTCRACRARTVAGKKVAAR